MLSGDRLHLQHGPSDLIIWAEGERELAYRAAGKRFSTIIGEIVSELPALQERMSLMTLEPKARSQGECMMRAYLLEALAI